jgi:alkylresorcinol/alkylpyrone synthase
MYPVLKSLGLAVPEHYMSQKEAYDFFCSHYHLQPQEKNLYQKVLLDGAIKGRYIAVEHFNLDTPLNQDGLIAQFTSNGRRLALDAAKNALASAACQKEQIKALIVNTCTGYLCPGLTSYLAQDLALPDSTPVYDLMGMGCGAAIPNLHLASKLADPDGIILSVAVEVCSATMFRSPDPGCVISNCIFGDGAAAACIAHPDNASDGLLQIIDFESGIFPQYRDELRYVSDNGQLRNVLTLRVPVIGAKTAFTVTSRLLKRHNLSFDDIHSWAIHPGGTLVLEEIRKKFNLSRDAVSFSNSIFENYGNMSSPSVLFVLKSILDNQTRIPGKYCLALSFGAGFSAHAMLCRFI